MATGSGKTFTAVTQIFRLAHYAKAKRVLFLVDRGNLGRQAKKEFEQTPDYADVSAQQRHDGSAGRVSDARGAGRIRRNLRGRVQLIGRHSIRR